MESGFSKFSKKFRFHDLLESVLYCSLCPRMHHRPKILSEANGNLNSKVLFIAEAPGRLGADRTGIPLFGDKTGENFENLLGNVGWKREDIFITNAILCNPRKENGNNGTPSLEEIKNCSCYLEMTINLIQPDVVISLGRVALDALSFIFPHNINLSQNVANIFDWYNRKLVPLYHPGPRALIHRTYSKQTSDFIFLSKKFHPLKGVLNKKNTIKNKDVFHLDSLISKPLNQVIYAITKYLKELTYFKLVKLLYLIDLTAIEKLGSTITDQVYLRQQDGPWIPKLMNIIKQMNNFELKISWRGNQQIIKMGPMSMLNLTLEDKKLDVIAEIITKYGNMSNASIKTSVYRTAPMKFILKEEKFGKKMLNKAIIYKNKTILDLKNAN